MPWRCESCEWEGTKEDLSRVKIPTIGAWYECPTCDSEDVFEVNYCSRCAVEEIMLLEGEDPEKALCASCVREDVPHAI